MRTETTGRSFWDALSWLFGFVVLAIGAINTFWGNDPGFGIFIVCLSFLYFPPLTALFREKTGFRIPSILKILVGAFVLWAALGVGELIDKIDMMLTELR